jgi:ubiquinone/menaquinone biosynthesis C-methylase UbiE
VRGAAPSERFHDLSAESAMNDRDPKDEPAPRAVLETAYMGQAAGTYDTLRFTTKHGLAFDQLEREQLMHVVEQLTPGATVLEVGCGTARFAIQLAKMGFRVTGSDASPDMLKIAGEKARGVSNIDFRLSEGSHIGFQSNSYDFVFAIRVMNSLESTQYALETAREMIRVTKPGGLVLIEFANADRPLARQNNSVRLSFGQLRTLAEAQGCTVTRESGVLVFSQTILNAMPGFVLPAWVAAERALASRFRGLASRGYIALRKNTRS